MNESSTILNEALQQYFGFDSFREGQAEAIGNLLSGHSSLAIFPTGSGKSLCYQLSALLLPNLTLVVSPLLALMKDQISFLNGKGIAAASLDSTLSAEQSQQVMSDIRKGKTKILMVSVERFKNERFRQFMQTISVSMLVVDEAHCISEWGHNFRPDYLKLPQYRQQLNIPLVLLLTATATKKVKLDMANKFAIEAEHIVQTGFYRKNLDLSVMPVANEAKKSTLVEVMAQLMGAGIVYVTLQKTAQEVADYLAKQGLNAQAYHAGLGNESRQQIQDDFMHNKLDIVVATIAFGMGVDKANIRYVIHYDLPKSIENYSQEIGRAGRDGGLSHCITLANLDGMTTVENFVYGDTPELDSIAALLDNIKSEQVNERWEFQINQLSNLTNIRQLPLKTLLVQLELQAVLRPLYSYYAEFKIKLEKSADELIGLFSGERQDFVKALLAATRFKKVWGELDIESLLKTYPCERSRVLTALEYFQEHQYIDMQNRLMTEVYQVESVIDTELVKGLHAYFVEKEESEIKRIARLLRFFELDRCLSYNLAAYFDDVNVPSQCGHCSVCRGQIAKLSCTSTVTWPNDDFIAQAMMALKTHLASKVDKEINSSAYAKFLAGISVPLFSRFRVKQVNGFACCEQLPYADILAKVKLIQENMTAN